MLALPRCGILEELRESVSTYQAYVVEAAAGLHHKRLEELYMRVRRPRGVVVLDPVPPLGPLGLVDAERRVAQLLVQQHGQLRVRGVGAPLPPTVRAIGRRHTRHGTGNLAQERCNRALRRRGRVRQPSLARARHRPWHAGIQQKSDDDEHEQRERKATPAEPGRRDPAAHAGPRRFRRRRERQVLAAGHGVVNGAAGRACGGRRRPTALAIFFFLFWAAPRRLLLDAL